MRLSNETEALFTVLRQSAGREAVGAIERHVEVAPDRELCRMNALAFAAARGFKEEEVITAFLHASRLGIFELSWNVLCPGCSGVLQTSATLKSVRQSEYSCSLCAAGYETTLDEMVEVTFTVSPRVRRVAGHDPHTLPTWEYYRQIFWGSGLDLPDDDTFQELVDRIVLDSVELAPGDKAILSLQASIGFLIIFDPVIHMAQFIDVQEEPTRERRNISFVMDKEHAPTGTMRLAPGPVRLTLENRSALRTLPSIWIAGDDLHALLGKRKPFLTAKRLLTNQTFRDIYRTDTLDVTQRLKITSLTFLFTDLKGSTELYERVGDLVAYDLVQAHFLVVNDIVAGEGGAVVKTIGDAVMATFPTPDRAVAAALRMREAVGDLNKDLLLKIGIHEGPCLAVMLNERQDYFGQTVNVASRVQNLAVARAIFATGQVIGNSEASRLLKTSGIMPTPQSHVVRGIANQVTVYEIP
jgi:class 3 adenylate cyclase